MIGMPVLGLAGCRITKLCPRHPCQDLQVQVNDQFTLPPLYHSFVASGRYDGPDAPAVKIQLKQETSEGKRGKTTCGSFTSIQMFHTHMYTQYVL